MTEMKNSDYDRDKENDLEQSHAEFISDSSVLESEYGSDSESDILPICCYCKTLLSSNDHESCDKEI